jgi:hypothetical protein
MRMKLNATSALRAVHRVLVCLCVVGVLDGCTENRRARTYGGTADVNVAPGQRVINATWKGANLWVLTRPLRADEAPETLTFHEFSAWGISEGTFVLHESAAKKP